MSTSDFAFGVIVGVVAHLGAASEIGPGAEEEATGDGTGRVLALLQRILPGHSLNASFK
jgi:hypothetical protein